MCGCGGPSLSPRLARSVGAACRRGGGGPSSWGTACHRCEGCASGIRRCPSPGRPPSGAGGRGSATRVSRVRLVRAWGPSTGPTAALCAVGVAKGRLQEGCLSPVWGGAEVRRSPSPGCPPSGRAVGVHYPLAVGVGVRVRGPSAVPLACTPCGGCAPRGWLGPSPGGVACHRCGGRLVLGAAPLPAARPWGRAARVPRPVCPGCGWSGCGDPAPAPQRAPLWADIACCGGGGRASPGGVPFVVARGVCSQALPLT